MLAFLLNRPDLPHSPEMARAIIRTCIEAGGIHGGIYATLMDSAGWGYFCECGLRGWRWFGS
jgi:hypothetical protein